MDLLKVANRAAEKRAFLGMSMPSFKTIKRVGSVAMSDGGFASIDAGVSLAKRTFGAAKASIPNPERMMQ